MHCQGLLMFNEDLLWYTVDMCMCSIKSSLNLGSVTYGIEGALAFCFNTHIFSKFLKFSQAVCMMFMWIFCFQVLFLKLCKVGVK